MALERLGLVTRRLWSDGSGVNEHNARLTELGLLLCKNIETYRIETAHSEEWKSPDSTKEIRATEEKGLDRSRSLAVVIDRSIAGCKRAIVWGAAVFVVHAKYNPCCNTALQ